jgi:hypothetical protein
MTPSAFFSLIKMHNRYEGGEEQEESESDYLTPQELMSWR